MSLQYPGEYGQPQTRHQEIRVPAVPSFTTARLEAVPTVSDLGTNQELYQTSVLLQNTGDKSVTVQLKQTDSWVSGPRENIGPAVELVPSGARSFTIYPDQKYLELWSSGTNSSTVRLAVDSRLRWSVLGFNRTDTNYPDVLWEADVPDAGSL